MSIFAPPDDTLPLLTQFRQLKMVANGADDELYEWLRIGYEPIDGDYDVVTEDDKRAQIMWRVNGARGLQWPIACVMDAIADDIDAPQPKIDSSRAERLAALDAAAWVINEYSRKTWLSCEGISRGYGVRIEYVTSHSGPSGSIERDLLKELWRVVENRDGRPVRRCKRCGFSFVVTQEHETYCSARCTNDPGRASP